VKALVLGVMTKSVEAGLQRRLYGRNEGLLFVLAFSAFIFNGR